MKAAAKNAATSTTASGYSPRPGWVLTHSEWFSHMLLARERAKEINRRTVQDGAGWFRRDDRTGPERTAMYYGPGRMPFGKHKGSHVRDIPTSYLAWLLRECN